MTRKVVGWSLTGLLSAFFLFDAGIKLARPASVMQAFVKSGWPADLSITLGVILLVCTALFLIPRTAVLGAVLLTGYLGGAVATNLRLHNPIWLYTLFPVYFGILVWLAVRLREPKVNSVLPLV